jgi:hypothetical protein
LIKVIYSLISAAFLIFIASSCDKRNITEPRLYSGQELKDVDSLWADSTHTALRFDYALPHSAHVNATVLASSGREVRTFTGTVEEAGLHTILWDLTNDNGNRVDNGIYAFSLRAGDENRMIWFELKNN